MLGWFVLAVLLLVFSLCTYYIIRIVLQRPLSYFAKVFILCADLVAVVGMFLFLFLWLFR